MKEANKRSEDYVGKRNMIKETHFLQNVQRRDVERKRELEGR